MEEWKRTERTGRNNLVDRLINITEKLKKRGSRYEMARQGKEREE